MQGSGGILPPTDPRLKDLTDEQIELDFYLYLEDHPELKKKAESYKDTEYKQAMMAELGPGPQQEQAVGPPAAEDWEDAPLD